GSPSAPVSGSTGTTYQMADCSPGSGVVEISSPRPPPSARRTRRGSSPPERRAGRGSCVTSRTAPRSARANVTESVPLDGSCNWRGRPFTRCIASLDSRNQCLQGDIEVVQFDPHAQSPGPQSLLISFSAPPVAPLQDHTLTLGEELLAERP